MYACMHVNDMISIYRSAKVKMHKELGGVHALGGERGEEEELGHLRF
jgi:hypothetical protein